MTIINHAVVVQTFLDAQPKHKKSPNYQTMKGFLHGMSITPGPAPADEWLSYVIPDYETTDKLPGNIEQIIESIDQIYREKVTAFQLNQLEWPFDLKEMLAHNAPLVPLLSWIQGFVDALYMRAEFWDGNELTNLDETKHQLLFHCMLMIEGTLEPEMVFEVFEKLPPEILRQNYPTLDLTSEAVMHQLLMICVMSSGDAVQVLQDHARELGKARIKEA